MSLKPRRAASFALTTLFLTALLLPLGLIAPTAKAAALYDSGDPSPAEQLVLEYINRARADPIAEGQRLGIDIHEGLSDTSLVGPRPPLAMNKILLSIATAHSENMYTQNYFSHNDPNGNTPFDRISLAGYDYVLAGENMAAGTTVSATGLEDLMMIDAGTPGRPHRMNLLDLISPYRCGDPPCAYYELGIGYYQGATPNAIGLGSLITEDFGATANTGPFLLGVVYDDRNGNNFYDIGEGIAGVTIMPSSSGYYAVSSTSGGYVIPIGTSGTITVTASGLGFGPITKTVTLNGANVKLDFTPQSSSVSTSVTLSQTTTTQASSTSTVTTTQTSAIFTTTSSSTTSSSSQTTTSSTESTTSTTSTTTGEQGSTSTQTTESATTTSTVTASSQTAVTSSQASYTSNTSAVPPDFSVSTSSNEISLPQSASGTLGVIVQSKGSFNHQVHLDASGLPEGAQISFSPDPVTPPADGIIDSTATLIVTRSVPTGIYRIIISATNGTLVKQVPVTLRVSGCLIATATFGSELAPEVQFLRDFRDYRILQTFAGSSFMVAFNAWYYSFSPQVAQYEYQHPTFQTVMKYSLYPLIWILKIGAIVFDLFSFSQEVAAILAGMTTSALLGAVYVGAPLSFLRSRLSRKRQQLVRKFERICFTLLLCAALTAAISELLRFQTTMILVTSTMVIATVVISGLWTSKMFAMCTFSLAELTSKFRRERLGFERRLIWDDV